MLTLETLKASGVYKEWIEEEKVILIHNTYHDSKDEYAAFIVVYSGEKENTFSIARFFTMWDKIQVSIDFNEITTVEVFEALLSKYSRGLA